MTKWVFLISFFLLIGVISIIANLTSKEEEPKSNPEGTYTHTKEQIDQWKEEVGKTYDEFTEEENKKGENAAQLAEESYIKKYGEMRETSYFYAETLKNNLFVVIGIDRLDGRDARFIEYHVNLDTNEVIEVDTTKQ